MVEISVLEGDIIKRRCDLLLLKHADGFYGVDKVVSKTIGCSQPVRNGSYAFHPGGGTLAECVLFLGVGPLQEFRYERIYEFSSRALGIAAREKPYAETICAPAHGPGYGLDEKEAFLSLVSGFTAAITNGDMPENLKQIEIVEISPRRARRFQSILSEIKAEPSIPHLPVGGKSRTDSNYGDSGHGKFTGAASRLSVTSGRPEFNRRLESFGLKSESKIKLFVAMPFADDYSDVWDIAIQEGCAAANVLCERVKEEAYVGDILTEIKRRLTKCDGVLAVLDGANPNVFLEIGYAWALEKPTILICREELEPPFDVRNQKRITYRKLNSLRTELAQELKSLQQQGILRSLRSGLNGVKPD